MKRFSIRELEAFSDIKMHTIRMWEKRYSLFKPQRNMGNTRSYTIEEVDHLLRLALLNKNGYKISLLSKMNKCEIETEISSISSKDVLEQKAISDLIVCMFTRDTSEFERILDDTVSHVGLDATITNVIIPFLEKVKVMSYKDSSIEVHFVVTAVRRKIIAGIEKAQATPASAQSVLLYLPKGEHYDLMLLYMNYIFKCQGFKILYLGTNISQQNLQEVVKDKQPDFIFTYLCSKTHHKAADFSDSISMNSPATKFYVVSTDAVNLNVKTDNVKAIEYSLLVDTIEAIADKVEVRRKPANLPVASASFLYQ